MKKAQEGVPEVTLPVSYRDRLASYTDLQSDNVIAVSYAAAGFSYAVETGDIYCDRCGLKLRGCDAQNYDPLSLHQTFSQNCSYVNQHHLSDIPNVSGEYNLPLEKLFHFIN